jgi:hypothetical protein
MYLGTWVADLTAHKIPVVENVDRCHCKVPRTGTDPKSSIVGRAVGCASVALVSNALAEVRGGPGVGPGVVLGARLPKK